MKNRALLIIFMFPAVVALGQSINYTPKILMKDLRKIAGGEVALEPITVPDSIYNDLLLDKGKYFTVRGGNEQAGYVYSGRVYSCRAGGCGDDAGRESVPVDDDYEYFDYFIIFNKDLSVNKVRVYNYRATHGQEVGGKGWLRQFANYRGEEKLEYGKNIDALSGATISANAITYNVQESVRFINLLLKTMNGKNVLKALNQDMSMPTGQ